MSEIVNGLMLSDATRARLVEIARKLDAGKTELQRAYLAGEISPAQMKERVATLMTEVRALSAPITREIDDAMALAHREHQGVTHESRNSLN